MLAGDGRHKAEGFAMGWNDHVDFSETECLDCGAISTWEYWDSVARQRYVGRIGEMLGVDANRSDKCPHCGSTNGRIVEDDDDDDGWSDC
jgi:hypothetical protein